MTGVTLEEEVEEEARVKNSAERGGRQRCVGFWRAGVGGFIGRYGGGDQGVAEDGEEGF